MPVASIASIKINDVSVFDAFAYWACKFSDTCCLEAIRTLFLTMGKAIYHINRDTLAIIPVRCFD